MQNNPALALHLQAQQICNTAIGRIASSYTSPDPPTLAYLRWMMAKQVAVHPHPALHLEPPNHHRARPYSTAESQVKYVRSVGTSQNGQEYR